MILLKTFKINVETSSKHQQKDAELIWIHKSFSAPFFVGSDDPALFYFLLTERRSHRSYVTAAKRRAVGLRLRIITRHTFLLPSRVRPIRVELSWNLEILKFRWFPNAADSRRVINMLTLCRASRTLCESVWLMLLGILGAADVRSRPSEASDCRGRWILAINLTLILSDILNLHEKKKEQVFRGNSFSLLDSQLRCIRDNSSST